MEKKLNKNQQQLVEENCGWALKYGERAARKYGIQMGDVEVIQDAALDGLFNAALGFDETKNVKFKTYATRCVNNSICDAYRKIKRLSSDACKIINIFHKTKNELAAVRGYDPSDEEVCEFAGIDKKKFRKLQKYRDGLLNISLNNDSIGDYEFYEMLGDHSCIDPMLNAILDEARGRVVESLAKIDLTEDEQKRFNVVWGSEAGLKAFVEVASSRQWSYEQTVEWVLRKKCKSGKNVNLIKT